MLPGTTGGDYLNSIHKRRAKVLFDFRSDRVGVAYTKRKSKLSNAEKAKIRQEIKHGNQTNWFKAIMILLVSILVSYLLLSLISSLFLGFWHFF